MRSALGSRKALGITLVSVTALLVPIFLQAAPMPVKSSSITKVSPQTQSPKKSDMLYATGEGAMPTVQEQPNRAKAYIQAKSYAKAQAVANLVQAVRGTSIVYHGVGRDYAMEEQVSQEIDGIVQNVQVVSERKVQIGKDTVVEITVQAPVPESWKDVPLPEKPVAAKPGPSWLVASTKPVAPSTASFRKAKEAAYTSVIIDTLGLGVTRSMSPKVLRADGSEVWGTVKVDYDFVADHGIVAYARTLGEAYLNERAGDNPLVLRAIHRGSSAYKCDVILSDDDADYMLSESSRSGFLHDFRVIFLVDGGR